MKSTRKKYLPNTAKENFSEAILEIFFWLVVLAAALAVAMLFPHEVTENIPFEIFLIPGFIIGMLIFLAVIFLIQKKKKNKPKKSHKDLHELFEDISAVAPTAVLEDKSIKLFACGSMLKIKAGDGFSTCLNNRPEDFTISENDIYAYALEFMHDEAKPPVEIEIDDTCFTKSDESGNLIYKDYFARLHTLSASEYEFESGEKTCTFRKSGINIKVNFPGAYVIKKKNRLLSGSRKKRIKTLISIVK